MLEAIRRFAGFQYSSEMGLERDGQPIRLGPQARQLLELLLDARGEIVAKELIAAKLWPGQPVSDDSIDRCAYLLRKPIKALGLPDVVATSYGKGLFLRARVEVVGDGGVAGARSSAANTQALDLWQVAYELAGRRTRDGYARAQEAIAAAARLHPESGPVWALAAELYAGRVMRGFLPLREAPPLIEDCASRALRLCPDFPPALAVLGWSRAVLGRRQDEGLALIDRSLTVGAYYSKSCSYRAWALVALDRVGEARADLDAGLRRSPLDQGLLSLRAWVTLCAGETGQAVEQARQGLELRPDAGMLWLILSMASSFAENHEEAVRCARRGLDIVGEDPFYLSVLAYAHAAGGERADARAALNRASAVEGAAAPPTFFAAPLAALGQTEDAAGFLRVAAQSKCPWFAFAAHDPRFASLRPEIAELKQSAALAEPL